MASSVISIASEVRSGSGFFNAVFYASVLPFICFPILFAGNVPASSDTVKQTLLFLANAHIGVTLYFYWDHDFRRILRENHRRYIWFPLAAITGAGLSYAVLPERYSALWWAAYLFWQNWHFGKQNFGVYSLIAHDQTPGLRVSTFERWLLLGSTIAGAIGALFFAVTDSSPWQSFALALRSIGGYVTLGLLVLGAAFLVASWRRFNLARASFLMFCLLFFGPQFVSSQMDVAFTPYSLSHSFQYLFFMTVVAFNQSQHESPTDPRSTRTLLSALVFFSLILFGGAVLTIRGDFAQLLGPLGASIPGLSRFVVGAMSGLVVAHFIIDAHAWRLRDKPQREFVLDRFRFIGKNPTWSVNRGDVSAV